MGVALGLLLCAPTSLGPAFCLQQGDSPGEVQPALPEDLVIPAAPPLSASEEHATFKLPDGLEIELVASEPLVVDPVAMAFDGDGRLWVAEMRAFMPNVDGTGEDEPNGVIAVLSDEDGDGRMDRRVEFMSGLVLPRAVMPVRSGALVIAPPDLIYAEDTDGDGVADQRTLIATNLGGIDSPEHATNGLLYTDDNWFRCANRGVRYRFVDDLFEDGQWEQGRTAGGGQWGITKDDFGRVFYNTNSDPLRGDLLPSPYADRNPNHGRAFGVNVRIAHDLAVWPARMTPGVNRGYRAETLRADFSLAAFTGACGPGIYRGDALPAEYRGNAFVSEPCGNLVKRYVLREQNGIGLVAENAWMGREFLTSTDERFRPVNIYDGPDGGLYIVDFYRGILQHKIFMTTFLRKQVIARGLAEPVGLGRIWRIVPTGFKRSALAKASAASWEDLGKWLASPNGFLRDTAQRLFVEDGLGEEKAVAVLEAVASASPSALARKHALWALDGLGAIDVELLARALEDGAEVVLLAALRIAEPHLAQTGSKMLRQLRPLMGHSSPRVVHQLVLTLGVGRNEACEQALLTILGEHVEQRGFRSAVMTGLYQRELGFLESLLDDARWSTASAGRKSFIALLARAIARDGRSDQLESLLARALELPEQRGWQRTAILGGLLSGRSKGPRGELLALQLAAPPACLPALAASQDERTVELFAALAWPGRAGVSAVAEVRPLDDLEQLYYEDGKEIYAEICNQCHTAAGRGEPGKAPALRQSEWVLGSEERLVRILMHGMRGPLTIDGEEWNLDMPAYTGGDEDLAAVLTYIRREWGHGADPVDPDRVEAIRKATRERRDAWTVDELRRVP